MNVNDAGVLLHIINLAKDWPNLKGIHDLAMKQLASINRDCVEQLAKEKADEDKKATEVEAKRQAEARKQWEEQEKQDKDREEATKKQREQPVAPSVPIFPVQEENSDERRA